MRFTRNAMRSPSKLGILIWRWSLMTFPLSSKKCCSRIPPSAFNPAYAVKSYKASWDRFIAADPHHREWKLRSSASQGTYILCSEGLQAQYSSSKQYITHHRAASRSASKKNEKMALRCFYLHGCRGEGNIFLEKK